MKDMHTTALVTLARNVMHGLNVQGQADLYSTLTTLERSAYEAGDLASAKAFAVVADEVGALLDDAERDYQREANADLAYQTALERQRDSDAGAYRREEQRFRDYDDGIIADDDH
jgi:hypothetical protein